MTGIIKEYGLDSVNMQQKLMRSLGLVRQEKSGKFYRAINNDCVMETLDMPDNSVDLIHTSIPFSNHYEYTPSYNDMGHNENNDRFFEQMDFLTPELLRILRPGRLAVIHVKDRILFGNATGTGMPTVDPFSDMTVFHYIKHGFQYMGRITIETDVVRENNQTNRLGWSEKCKDGSKMGVGCPEYLLLFRKLPTDTTKAYADVPVARTKKEYPRGRWQIDARAKWNSSGNRFLSPEEIKRLSIEQVNRYFSAFAEDSVYDYSEHVKIAKTLEDKKSLPASFETLRYPARTAWVWGDVNRMLTLNSSQQRKHLQAHICPLQIDIVDRVIENWSNKGETIFDPFGGIMTVPYRAVMLGRRGIATELNPDYWRDGLKYLASAEIDVSTPTLFDLLECKHKNEIV
jgi:DNA modification methylase